MATRSDMVRMLRVHLNDEQSIGWEDDTELVDFLDRAVSFLTHMLIAMKHNSMIAGLLVDGPTQLPENFISFVGKYPIQILQGLAIPYGRVDLDKGVNIWDDPNIARMFQGPTWKTYSEEPDDSGGPETSEDMEDLLTAPRFNTFYWARLPYVSSFLDEDTLPYTPEFGALITDLARMLALNKNEYELSQDQSMFQTVMTALNAVIKGDEQ